MIYKSEPHHQTFFFLFLISSSSNTFNVTCSLRVLIRNTGYAGPFVRPRDRARGEPLTRRPTKSRHAVANRLSAHSRHRKVMSDLTPYPHTHTLIIKVCRRLCTRIHTLTTYKSRVKFLGSTRL